MYRTYILKCFYFERMSMDDVLTEYIFKDMTRSEKTVYFHSKLFRVQEDTTIL